MPGEKVYKIFVTTLRLIGLLLIAISINPFLKNIQLFKSGLYSTGKVVKIDDYFSKSLKFPYVEFATNNEKKVTILSEDCKKEAFKDCPEIGDVATVIYNPSSPENAKVLNITSKDTAFDYYYNVYFEPVAPGVIGLFLILISFTDLFDKLRKAKKVRWI